MNLTLAGVAVLAIPMILCASMSARASEYDLWVEHSAVKLLRDAKPPAKPATSATLYAARREWESVQIALRSESEAIAGVRVKASDLKQVGGKSVIPADRVSLLRVAYVPIKDPPVPYPDPLPPLTELDLKPGETQPVWVTVKVPEDCPPGDYEGSLAISADGTKSGRVPVRVHVWDFELPVTPKCTTAFGIWMDWVARAHGTTGDAAKNLDLHKKYYELLLDHKISAYQIPVDLKSPEAKAYLEDPRMTSYTIPYSADDAELRSLVTHLIENDWFRKGYFYPIDEPGSEESYKQMQAITARLRSVEPRYRIVVPFFRGPEFAEGKTIWDLALNDINIWCPNEHYLDLEKRTRPFLQSRRNVGDDVWWYVCCGPGEPYANFFVEMSAMNHRMLFWHQKREKIDGLLYWATTYWNPAAGCDDPWKTMQTVKDINPNIHGDGSLLYPGKQVGIDGPVSSLRLEVIRDGIEDFDYLCLAEKLIGEEATSGYIRRLARSLTDYEHDPWKLEKVRRDVGDAIERAVRAGDGVME
jgi:hypothetical protein